MPVPSPHTAMPAAIHSSGVVAVICASPTSPVANTTMPTIAGQRVPMRSENVPLSGAAIATQAIITFLYAWNSFIWPLIIIGDSPIENHVVTLSLNTLKNAAASEPNLVLTGAAVVILPPLILFILAQRYFVEGIANTGMK